MNDSTWERLEQHFAEFPEARCEPVGMAEIEAMEATVGVPLSRDYKESIARYGGALAGTFPIFGLRKSSYMGNGQDTFLKVTKGYRECGWPEVDKWVVFSMDHAGNPIGMDKDGKVWLYDFEIPSLENIADDFEAYLLEQCLNFDET